MTSIYELTDYPNIRAIKCPKCSHEATFKKTRHGYEKQFGGYRKYIQVGPPWEGICSCSSCGYFGNIKIDWPQSAFYQIEIKGHTLWAWNREYCEVLLDFITSNDRNPMNYGKYHMFLRSIPGLFKFRNNRDKISAGFNEKLKLV